MAPSHIMVSRVDKHYCSKYLLWLLFPITLDTEHGLGYPFGQSGSPPPAVSPPSFPCTPSILVSMPVKEAEKAWTPHKSCPRITKPSLYYQLSVQLKHRAQTHTSHCEESHPRQNQHHWYYKHILKPCLP